MIAHLNPRYLYKRIVVNSFTCIIIVFKEPLSFRGTAIFTVEMKLYIGGSLR